MDLHDTRDNELLAQVPAATTATLAAVVAPPAAAPSTSEGSSAVRVAAPPQPPLDQPARQNGSLTRRVDVVVGLLTSAGQLMAWRRGAASAAGLSTARHVDQLALVSVGLQVTPPPPPPRDATSPCRQVEFYQHRNAVRMFAAPDAGPPPAPPSPPTPPHLMLQVAMNAAFLLQALCLPYAWWLCFRWAWVPWEAEARRPAGQHGQNGRWRPSRAKLAAGRGPRQVCRGFAVLLAQQRGWDAQRAQRRCDYSSRRPPVCCATASCLFVVPSFLPCFMPSWFL